jgi:hypothetical protein
MRISDDFPKEDYRRRAKNSQARRHALKLAASFDEAPETAARAARMRYHSERFRFGDEDISDAGRKEAFVANYASGTFDVKLTPQVDGDAEVPSVGRMSIEKKFGGGLEATSKGQMLAVRTETQGSAGYVAMERVSGALDGRAGTFALQHSGTMTRGEQQLSITVVPDSGTGQLAGLAGRMTISVSEGKHSYEFEYTLDQPG